MGRRSFKHQARSLIISVTETGFRTSVCFWNIIWELVKGQDQMRRTECGKAGKEDGCGPCNRG